MRKAQAAMEFLSTYGWMMIALSVGVFAAFSLGLFDNPANKLADTCNFVEGFQCVDSTIHPDGTIDLNLKNLVGNDITIDKVNCAYMQESVDQSFSMDVSSGATASVWCRLATVPSNSKDKLKFTVNVLYRETGMLLEKSATGSLILTMSSS